MQLTKTEIMEAQELLAKHIEACYPTRGLRYLYSLTLKYWYCMVGVLVVVPYQVPVPTVMVSYRN